MNFVVTIDVSSENKKLKKTKFPLYIAVLLLTFLGSFTYFSSFKPIEKGKSVLGINDNFIQKYETYEISIDNSIDEDLGEKIRKILTEMEKDGQKRFEITSNANINVRFGLIEDGEESLSYIVPVTDFYSVKDDIAKDEIESSEVSVSAMYIGEILNEKFPKLSYKVDEDSEDVVFADIAQLDHLKKLLSLDGKYFLDDVNGGVAYGVVIEGNPSDFVKELLTKRIATTLDSGFKQSEVAKINMTGVTAITRNLALKVDNSGDYGYSSNLIADFLKDADLTHVSNEISFVPGCVPSQGMRFCSRPEYLESLLDSGVDIVELTGNHNNDYGASFNTSTIELYTEKGLDHFGGGLNDEDASKILYKEVKGSKIAFIGYNYYDTMLGTGAIAGTERAGANSYSEEKMQKNILEAKESADIVIVDFQFQECYSYPESGGIYPICYKPLSYPDQKGVFRLAVDFGADIVIGTQAHQPQTYEIYEGKPIYYGLGNLFFDQIYWVGTRQGLILTHYIYEGKLLQTKLTTTYYENDMKTYVTEGDKRLELLELLRDAR